MFGMVWIGLSYAAGLAVVWIFLDAFFADGAIQIIAAIVLGAVVAGAITLYQMFSRRLSRMEQRLDSVEKKLDELTNHKSENE